MKVTVSIPGRGGTFYLVQQLLKRGYLAKLITSYPKFEVKKYGIPKSKTESILIKEILARIWQRLPRHLRSLYDPSFLFAEVFDKSAARRVDKCDIIWTWTHYALHAIRKAKKLGAITLVELGNAHVNYHHDVLRSELERFGVKWQKPNPKFVERAFQEYEEADYFPVPSSYVKRTMVEEGIPAEKVLVVPYGVDLSEFRQIPKKDNVFRVIFAGGMTIRKGLHYLLQAFSELNLPNSELVLLGTINDEIKPFFKKYEGKFKHLGHIPQRELYKYYSQGSVFVLPSLDDGFGLVIVQAMACGLPVIVSENTGGPDIIENGKEGFIIPIRDVSVLKEKLLYLYENQDAAREMGEAARGKVADGFTWDDYGERIIKVFKRLLEERGVPRRS